MTGRQLAGWTVIALLCLVGVGAIVAVSTPWWQGPLAVVGALALAATIIWALGAVLDP